MAGVFLFVDAQVVLLMDNGGALKRGCARACYLRTGIIENGARTSRISLWIKGENKVKMIPRQTTELTRSQLQRPKLGDILNFPVPTVGMNRCIGL